MLIMAAAFAFAPKGKLQNLLPAGFLACDANGNQPSQKIPVTDLA